MNPSLTTAMGIVVLFTMTIELHMIYLGWVQSNVSPLLHKVVTQRTRRNGVLARQVGILCFLVWLHGYGSFHDIVVSSRELLFGSNNFGRAVGLMMLPVILSPFVTLLCLVAIHFRPVMLNRKRCTKNGIVYDYERTPSGNKQKKIHCHAKVVNNHGNYSLYVVELV